MMHARQRAFTLIEMLVGLALLGMMTLALFSALRTGIHSWERAEVKGQQVVDFRIVEGVLRREFAKAFPLRVGLANENKIAFEGDPQRVRFVTALPAHFTPGGLSWVALEQVQDERTETGVYAKSLVLRHATLDGTVTDFAGLDQSDKVVLLRGLEQIEFSYFGQETDQTEPTWRRDWPQGARVPSLLSMKLKYVGSADLRELLMPLRLGEEAGCYQSSFQRQCGPRK